MVLWLLNHYKYNDLDSKLKHKLIWNNNSRKGKGETLICDFSNELYLFNVGNMNFILRFYGAEGRQFVFGFGICISKNSTYIPGTRIIILDRYYDHCDIVECYDIENNNTSNKTEKLIYSITLLK